MKAILILVAAAAATGCIPKAQPGSSAGAENTPEGRPCSGDGVIDDGEDGNNQVNPAKGRAGYWYTFVDTAGSSIVPAGQFSMTPGGADGSSSAARMTGKVGNGQIVFAGMGLTFTDPKTPYDATAYKGLTFKAKKGPGTGALRLKVPDVNTDPEGKVCTDKCFNDFGADIELAEKWTTYAFPFASMRQLPGWGSPRPASIDPSKLYGVQFQVNSPGASFDVWVDDLRFTGCQ